MKQITSFILFFISFYSFTQNSTLKGKVRDAKTNEYLVGVNVEIDGTEYGSITDIDGQYEISLNPGKYTIIFNYVGYKEIKLPIDLTSNQVKIIDQALEEEITLLDNIVVTGSKYEKKLGEETVSLDIIKPSFISKQNITGIDEAVKRSPGVTVVDGQPNIRGGSGWSYGAGSRVMVLQDDLPILDAAAGFPSWGSLPIENVSQIEIIKGASSALYGSAAMNGIINIRTAYPTSTPVTKISVYGGVTDNPNPNDFNITGDKIKVDKRWWLNDSIKIGDTTIDISNAKRPHVYGVQFGHRQKYGKIDLVLSGRVEKVNGYKFPDNSFNMRVSANVRYRINEKWNIGLSGNIQSGSSDNFFLWGGSGVGKYVPGALTGIPTASKTFRLLIDPYLNYSDEKGNKHKLLGRFYKSDNNNSNNQSNSVNQFYGEYQYQRRFDKINMSISTGIVAQYAIVNAELYAIPQSNSRNIAGYIQIDKKFWDKLNISAGFRFENNKISQSKSETKPVGRLGINYQPAKYTYIRASFGQGYRFPTIAEKFIRTNLSSAIEIRPNLDLKSETGISAEFGVKQGVKLGKNLNAFLDVAAFYNQYTNMMEFNPGADTKLNPVTGTEENIFYFQSRNVGNTRIYGTEITLFGEGDIANKFPTNLMIGYTFIRPEYRNYNPDSDAFKDDVVDYNVLKYRFRHTFTSAWDVQFSRFTFGLSGQYYSFMENLDGILLTVTGGLSEFRASKLKDNHENKKPQAKYKGDFVLDIRAGVLLGKKKNYNFSFNIKNITNREYMLRPGVIESPRNYAFRMDMTF